MNLYKILIQHSAPKDTIKAIKCLLLAENDEQVYEWIKAEPDLGEGAIYNGWSDAEEDDEIFDVYDDKYNVVGTETFKEKIIRIKGEMNDNEYDYSDAYYGITLYGWELLKENVKNDYADLIELGILIKVGI